MTKHQESAVEQCRKQYREFVEELGAVMGVTVTACNTDEQERKEPLFAGRTVQVAFYVVVQVAE